jgi:hypothetical protein
MPETTDATVSSSVAAIMKSLDVLGGAHKTCALIDETITKTIATINESRETSKAAAVIIDASRRTRLQQRLPRMIESRKAPSNPT